MVYRALQDLSSEHHYHPSLPPICFLTSSLTLNILFAHYLLPTWTSFLFLENTGYGWYNPFVFTLSWLLLCLNTHPCRSIPCSFLNFSESLLKCPTLNEILFILLKTATRFFYTLLFPSLNPIHSVPVVFP